MATGVTPKDVLATQGTAAATAPPSIVGKKTGSESSLSNWVGPYVTDMLGKAEALSTQPYEAYTGPLTAGPSALQQQAFQGVGNLVVPTEQMGAYTPQTFGAEQASQYMNPYIQQALQPQLQELQRQQEIKRVANAGRMTKSGAYGGGRQAIMESELDRAGLEQAGKLTGSAYLDAYNKAQQQFNTEQDRLRQAQELANKYGLAALQKQAALGATQQELEAEGVAADKAQFEKEWEYPYKQIQWAHSLLQGLPTGAQSYNYAQPSGLANILTGMAGTGGTGGILDALGGTSGIMGALGGIFGGGLPEIDMGSGWSGLPTSDESQVPDFLPGGYDSL
jgi:hypothetical protein